MRKKSDVSKLREGRGTGRGVDYKPWIYVHEYGTKGRNHRKRGWLNRRAHHLLSDIENNFFMITQWDDTVIDIREQFPLLSKEVTFNIAQEYGISHPPMNKKKFKDKIIMTTDLLVTRMIDDHIKDFAYSLKPEEKRYDKRTNEKLYIENMYWAKKGIQWESVYDSEINRVLANNLNILNSYYFWNEDRSYSNLEINALQSEAIEQIDLHGDVLFGLEEFERIVGWNQGSGIPFIKFLIVTKRAKVDLNKNFDFDKMEIL